MIRLRVELSWFETEWAGLVGMNRRIESLRDHRQAGHGLRDDDDPWTKDIEGAAGELAVAKAIDRFYSGSINTFREGGDVGRLQVRTARNESDRLIIRPADRDDDLFVFVIGRIPVFEVVGWIYGREGKRSRYLFNRDHNRPPAYFVPQIDLRSLDDPAFRKAIRLDAMVQRH